MEKQNLPKAKYSADIDLNGFILSSAILDDGTRVFSERSLANAFGIKGGGAYWKRKKGIENDSAVLPEYLSSKYLKGYISNELIEKFDSAISYISKSNIESRGVDATVLADICDVFVQAKNAGIKNANIITAADTAYTMIKSFAKVGIIALIDEATGYQYDREKTELQAILKAYISDDILEWQKAFHLNFYKEIFRLWKVPFTDQNIKRKPMFIGTLTNSLVYKNMPKGIFVLDRLKQKTPKTSGGNLRYRLHQSLTPEVGREALKKVIYSIETLAAVSDTKEQFKIFVEDRYGQRSLPFANWDELENVKEKEPEKATLNDFDNNLKILLNTAPLPKKDKK